MFPSTLATHAYHDQSPADGPIAVMLSARDGPHPLNGCAIAGDGPHPPIGNHEEIERERPIDAFGIAYEADPQSGHRAASITIQLRRMRFARGCFPLVSMTKVEARSTGRGALDGARILAAMSHTATLGV